MPRWVHAVSFKCNAAPHKVITDFGIDVMTSLERCIQVGVDGRSRSNVDNYTLFIKLLVRITQIHRRPTKNICDHAF